MLQKCIKTKESLRSSAVIVSSSHISVRLKENAVWNIIKVDSCHVRLNIIRTMLILPAGLYDMMGNTWEWTSTPFPAAQPMYVLRGASWIDTVDGSANHKARITTRWVVLFSDREPTEQLYCSVLMVLILCPAGWATLLTPPPITWDSGVLPATDRNKGRKRTKQNCSKQEVKNIEGQ